MRHRYEAHHALRAVVTTTVMVQSVKPTSEAGESMSFAQCFDTMSAKRSGVYFCYRQPTEIGRCCSQAARQAEGRHQVEGQHLVNVVAFLHRTYDHRHFIRFSNASMLCIRKAPRLLRILVPRGIFVSIWLVKLFVALSFVPYQ